jgi:DNA-binding transcriptional LysR family regulator
MERAKRLLDFWQYLPAFRFTAESESVTVAARNLGVTPSAVSRAVAALESGLGQKLFTRRGRTLELNRAGERLLLAVRRAMRGIDDGVEALEGGRLVGPLRLAAAEPAFSELVPRLALELRARHPGVVPHVTHLVEERLRQELMTGTVDVAFTTWVPTRRADDLTARRLGSSAVALFAPQTQVTSATPRAPRVAADVGHVELSCHVRRGGPWPTERARTICALVDDYATAALVASELGLVTTLPRSMGRRLGLVELATPRLAPLSLYAVTRTRLEEDSRAEIVVAIAAELSA